MNNRANGIMIAMLSLFLGMQTQAQMPHQNTHLYAQIAKGCKGIDVQNWHQPIKDTFNKYQITLQKIQLCNGNQYPIFIGKSKYRLNAVPNYRYASEFLMNLLVKNADWAYAFVETSSQEIFYVEKQGEEFFFEIEKY